MDHNFKGDMLTVQKLSAVVKKTDKDRKIFFYTSLECNRYA